MVLRVGVVGCGNISSIYIENSKRFQEYVVLACADLDDDKARESSIKYGIQKLSVQEMMASPEIDAILNLTVPSAHAAVSLEAIRNGKHVYSEKPIAISLEDGKKVIEEASKQGVFVGSAPDTFLGGSIQLAKRLIADGEIGKLVGASAFMLSRGPESWHPNPEFFYQKGGGPMFDMGPYYLTALVNLFGPAARVTGSAAITFTERTITAPEKFGEIIKVQIPTHISGILDFAFGGSATITTSFDVSAARTPFIEIYGEKGTISLPDPNQFNLLLQLRKQNDEAWLEIKPDGEAFENMRGIGVCDLASAIEKGTKLLADGKIGLHVLEIMHGIHHSSDTGSHYTMENSFDWSPGFNQNVVKHG
jgi:predicted dehydrogenase